VGSDGAGRQNHSLRSFILAPIPTTSHTRTLAVIASGQFGHMKYKLILLGLLISFASSGQVTIKGIVYDKVEPTPGVTVTELGTDNKVMTDMKGQFEIRTKNNNPTLTFTFTGFYPRTIKIKKNKFLKVKMKWEKRGRDIAMRLSKEATTANKMYVPLRDLV
jgi:hypothetical protein